MSECFIQLVGGLGNQLFQIAAVWAHCKRNGLRLKISRDTYGPRQGTYWSTYTHRFAQSIGPTTVVWPLWREPFFAYSPIPHSARGLSGYFQSSKYFADYADELRDMFVPSVDVQKAVSTKYADLLTTSSGYAVIHLRRGDFFMGANAPIHGILTESYYQRAMALVTKQHPDIRFLVFSDDLPWCRALTWLQEANVTFVDEPDTALALHLMSQFEHYVMSNSTFSWWAVWLGRTAKTVFVPDRWFGPRGPRDYQDIYEPEWTKVSVYDAV